MSGISVQRNPEINKELKDSWEHYKNAMIEKSGRPMADADVSDIDADGNCSEKLTFSEAVSYDLMRAVIMNDQSTFDSVWNWAKSNMQRKNISQIYNPKTREWQPMDQSKKDNLFAWRYAPEVDVRSGGVMSTYDFDPASDADQDIAASLIMAGKKWGSEGKVIYKFEAMAMLNDIWDKETIMIGGKRILIAGDTQIYANDPIRNVPANGVNISYFRPTYYEKLYAEFDTQHDWRSMVKPAYEVIQKAERAVLHNESGQPVISKVNLVPDWITIDASGTVGDHSWVPNDYYAGGDAFRTYIWMALQAKFNPADKFARDYCDCSGSSEISPCAFFKDQLGKNGTIFSGYSIDGTVKWGNESIQTIAVYMAYFWASGNNTGADKMLSKLEGIYNVNGFWGTKEDEYYGQNWAWFSLAMIANEDVISGEQSKITTNTLNNGGKKIINPQETIKEKTVETAKPDDLYVNKIMTSMNEFNDGEISSSDKGYLLTADYAKDAGVFINLNNVDLSEYRSIKFDVQGSVTKHGDYARLIMQVFKDSDNDYKPSFTLDPVPVSGTINSVILNIDGALKIAKKIQFMLITDNGSCRVEISNIRFEK